MPGWAMEHRVEELRPTFDVFSLGKVIWAMISGKPTLTLWYYNRPQNDLQKQFPDSHEMRLANELLAKCVVEDEDTCLPDASALLGEIDSLLDKILHGEDFVQATTRRCLTCRSGEYRLEADCDLTEVSRFGLSPSGPHTFKIFVCGTCGHVQLFRINPTSGKPKWSQLSK
jgi:hypothetical protein